MYSVNVVVSSSGGGGVSSSGSSSSSSISFGAYNFITAFVYHNYIKIV